MVVPLISAAAATAARIAAKKLATRAVGGITGPGARQVTKDFAEGNAVPIVAKTVKSTSSKNTPLVNDMLKQIKKDFKTVKTFKPTASRKESREVYVLGRTFLMSN